VIIKHSLGALEIIFSALLSLLLLFFLFLFLCLFLFQNCGRQQEFLDWNFGRSETFFGLEDVKGCPN